MNWLDFFASIAGSLAWPGCVLVITYFLKGELPKLIDGLRKLKYKDLELEFEKSSKAVAEKAQEALPEPRRPVQIAGQTQDDAANRLGFISDLAPRSAIIEAWLLVESAALDAVKKSNITTIKSLPGPMRLRAHLVKAGLLNAEQQAVFEQLRVLRNEAVHAVDAEFSSSAVHSYVESALKLAVYLEERANEL